MELALSVESPQVTEKRLSFFERYLTLWVALCMVAGFVIGRAVSGFVASLRGAEFGEGSHINLPIALQVYLNAGLVYGLMQRWRVPHAIAAPGALIGASNFFGPAVATAIALFGPESGAALATVVGVLVEVPIMLSVCNLCNRTRHWFGEEASA